MGEFVTLEQMEVLITLLAPPKPPPKPTATSRPKSATLNGLRKLSSDEIADALTYVGERDDRTRWLEIGMALKSELGKAGRALWDEWSQKSEKFNDADQDKHWGSIDAAGGITIGTLIKYAKDGGWQDPRAQQHKTQHAQYTNGASNAGALPSPAADAEPDPPDPYTDSALSS